MPIGWWGERMKGSTKIWVAAAITFVAFVLIALLIELLTDLAGGERWILWITFILLGAVAAGIVGWWMASRRRRSGEESAAGSPDDEVDALFADARRHLAASRVAGGASIAKLPVVVLLGPSGSTKTTLLVRSGLEPELLAGEVHRGETVVPTPVANVWFSQNAVFLDAGGRLLAEPVRWHRLLRHIQPSRVAAVVSKGTQAPRVAVVCYPCDEFLKPGAAETVQAAARNLRGRLIEMAQQLGIRLPVYVMFTKADRLPYFTDYVRSFTRSESQEVLGATLPAPERAGGSFAERETARLAAAFGSLFRSLALRRIDVLPRETQETVRSGAYEFPREFRKIADLATQFMVDLCRPSQLSVSPFLRGFYFTGVRPVVVSDAAAAAPAAPSAPGVPVDATSVFNPAMLKAAAQGSPAPSGSRRVPEWTFLRRLFGEVVLADRAAHAVTGGGTRLNLLRRGLLGAAALVLLIVSVGFTVSFARNRGLEGDVLEAARGVETIDLAATGVPALDALQSLEALGQRLDTLRRFEQEGAPLSMRWWLFSGDRLLPEVRRLYFERFGRLLWTGARADLLGYLSGLPDEPNETSEHDRTYNALKAHLVTTSHPQESTAEFLTPVLMEYWRIGRAPDDERAELARRQFERFARELPYGNPYGDQANATLLARTRAFLGEFGDADRFYQAMLAEAGRNSQPVMFNVLVPGSQIVVIETHTVPAAFTAPAWASVQTGLRDLDRLFERESWVVGDQTVQAADRAQLARALRDRYTNDYIQQWQQYLSSASVTRFGGLADAASKLGRLSGNESPLLRLFSIAASHTSIDSTSAIARAFQPVHAVTPSNQPDVLINEKNRPYVDALVALQSQLDQAAQAPPSGRSGALSGAAGSAQQGKLAVRQIAAEFSITPEAAVVGNAIQRLMVQPLNAAEAVIGALPRADVNGRGADFCRVLGPVLRKYPFSAGAQAEATVDDIAGALKPGQSALSELTTGVQELLSQQGDRYVAAAGADPRPRDAFLNALNDIVAASRAFYQAGQDGPEFQFLLRPQATPDVPRISIAVDDRTGYSTPNEARTIGLSWVGQRANTARITATVGGNEVTVAAAPGRWAVFRVLQQAQWQRQGSGWVLTWRVPGQPSTVSAQLTLPTGMAPILEPGWLGRLQCVGQIVG